LKLINKILQLVVKEEIELEILEGVGLDQYLLHVGLGHTVLDASQIKLDGKKGILDNFVSRFDETKYYYRLSFVESLKLPSESSRCYMTHEGNFFKPKISGELLYFLGLNFIIVEVLSTNTSKNFNINNYQCTIKKITVSAVTGDIVEELIWSKSKFGRIETYLPTKLKEYASPIIQCRKRLSLQQKTE